MAEAKPKAPVKLGQRGGSGLARKSKAGKGMPVGKTPMRVNLKGTGLQQALLRAGATGTGAPVGRAPRELTPKGPGPKNIDRVRRCV